MEIKLNLVPDAQIGDWVLVHAGFAIALLDKHEAAETNRLLEELGANDQ